MGKWFNDLTDFVGLDSGQKAAQEEANKAKRIQEETARQAREAETAQRNMQANFATDLSNQNAATVVAGGSADAVASVNDMVKKKRGQSLASTVGLNV